MKRLLDLLTVLLIAMPVMKMSAQTPKSDSLRRILRTDSVNFAVLIKMAKSLVDLDNGEAMLWAKRAHKIALRAGDTTDVVHASRVVGQLYNRTGDFEMAIKELTPLLSIAEQKHLNEEVKMILNSLGAAFTFTSQYDKALECHFKSLVLREMEGNKKDISISLNNIGLVYMMASNNEQALDYLNKCLVVKEEIGDRFDLHRLYGNLASCYSEIQDYSKADFYFWKALTECETNCGNEFLMFIEYCKGESYRNRKEYQKSKNCFAASLNLAIADNHSQYHFLSLNGLAKIALERNDMPAAEEYLTLIQRLPGKEPFLPQLQLFYDMSSDYFYRKRNFEKAFIFQRKYAEASERINNSHFNKRITDIQLRFVERENIQKIQDQQKLLSSQDIALQKQKIINALVSGLAILTILLVFVLFKMNKRKSQINHILDRLVKERTFELEKNRIALQHAYDAQAIVLERVGRELVSSLATIQGLSHVSAMENFINTREYLKGAEATLFRSIRAIHATSAIRSRG